MTKPSTADAVSRPWRRACGLAWPVLAQQLLGLGVSFTDRWLAGNVAPDNENQLAIQAAQTTCFYLAWMLGATGMLASAGASAVVSRLVGCRDAVGANKAFHQALLLAGCVGVVIWIVSIPLLDEFLAVIQLDGDAGRYALDFLRVPLLLLPLQLVGSTAAASLAASGDTRTSLLVGAGTTLLNLPIAWIGFRGIGSWKGLGFTGIAWGTGMSQAIGTIALLAILRHGRSGLTLMPRLLRPDWPMLRRLLRVSIPAAAEGLSMVAGQLVFLTVVNRLGDADRAAHGIALGWEAVAEVFGIAFGVAANVLVGQNLGARQPAEARRSGLAAYLIGGTAMAIGGVLFYSFAPGLFRLYCPRPEQQPIIDAGVPILRLVAWSMPMLASCHILSAALRGAGDTRFPFLFTWLGLFAVRIPLTFLLSLPAVALPGGLMIPGWNMGLVGCWIAMQVDLNVRGLLYLARFLRGRWMTTAV